MSKTTPQRNCGLAPQQTQMPLDQLVIDCGYGGHTAAGPPFSSTKMAAFVRLAHSFIHSFIHSVSPAMQLALKPVDLFCK